MNAKQYLADLTAVGLLLAETRPVANLLLSECSETIWQQGIVERKILHKKSAQTALRYACTINGELSR